MMRVAAMAAKGSLTPTRVYLVRHGQVADGHTDRYHGNNDIGLSDKGVRQFEDLAAQLAGVPLGGGLCLGPEPGLDRGGDHQPGA